MLQTTIYMLFEEFYWQQHAKDDYLYAAWRILLVNNMLQTTIYMLFEEFYW